MVRQVTVPVETRAPAGTTNAYILGDSDPLLVDPATWTADLEAATADTNVSHIAVTHYHPDHVGAVDRASTVLDATVWALDGRTPQFEDVTGVEPDRTFRPGDVLPAGDGIQIVDTPGHTPEHVAFSTDDALVVGDLAVADGSVVVGAPEGDMRAYLSSLRRVHARNPDVLYPGHGPTIDAPRETCRRLIAHRLDRERRVLAAVESGATALDDILDSAYEKDISAVRDLARATVVAHLEKLAVEGRIHYEDRRARPS